MFPGSLSAREGPRWRYLIIEIQMSRSSGSTISKNHSCPLTIFSTPPSLKTHPKSTRKTQTPLQNHYHPIKKYPRFRPSRGQTGLETPICEWNSLYFSHTFPGKRLGKNPQSFPATRFKKDIPFIRPCPPFRVFSYFLWIRCGRGEPSGSPLAEAG